jgi:hypothetical protein
VPRGEDLALAGGLENPVAGVVPGVVDLSGHAAPVNVHIDAKRCRGSVIGETARLQGALGQRQAEPAEGHGHGHLKVAGLAQVLEVFGKESVLPAVDGCPFVKGPEQVVGQDLAHATSPLGA